MKFKNMMLGMAIVGLAGIALAGEDVQIVINSEELGFDLRDLHGMQEGENRSIVDESGRNILITREADGFTLNIDGEIIELPMLFGGHHAMAWSEDGDEVDVNVHVMHRAQFAGRHGMDGTMIISRKPIDDATQQQIKLLLESAGYENDVNFIDREAVHGEQVFIKKIVKTDENPRS
ncbi:MAG: hypothetical protein IIA12_05075 [Proteobacteria bacterium]|nr:hypothetical protein [Pseudomonadota bacterium]